MSEREIEAHNRRELFRDVANHLTVAYESVEQAQSALDDLGLLGLARQLEDIVLELRQGATDARAGAGAEQG